MMLSRDHLNEKSFADISEMEWLETNGLGGWSGSSLSGCNTRRYHGLLMAAIHPPADRMLLVSKLDETLVMDGKKYELGTNDYGDVVSPTGFQYLRSFSKNFFPQWTFECGGVRLRKTITMVYGENTTLIRYEVLESTSSFSMQLLLLIAARGYHELRQASQNIFWDSQFDNGLFHNQPYENAPDIFVSVPGSEFQRTNNWYNHLNYEQEQYRGLDYQEDLFNHGIFNVNLKSGDDLYIMISTENPKDKNPAELFEKEKSRRISILSGAPGDLFRQLVLAADQFIVSRSLPAGPQNNSPIELKTIIAGYHWFTDWGRDTMISLPGLCLATNRYADAKKVIAVFSGYVNMGMLPNRFPDGNQPPEYNNVDGTLWFFNAVYAYLQSSGDKDFVLNDILPVLKEILEWHEKGTRYNIHVDSDGLLYSGAAGQQLTWMDARVGDWVVTPRMGKPVEIQALWFNALKIVETLCVLNEEPDEAERISGKASLTKKSFLEKYWFEKGNYLLDNIDESGKPDSSLRPNQVFAVSLPFPLIEGARAGAVMNILRTKLYTPAGLRSLAADDPKYIGHYGGDHLSRDSAYHQGTVWTWLLGPYLEAGMKSYGEQFIPEAKELISRFEDHLNLGCIGSVSEIADGNEPHHPRGCVAQAWSVAEMIRVIKKYSFFHAGS